MFRFWENNATFDVYPNPFFINDYNVIDGDGHVRFIYPSGNHSTVEIFDFNMEEVASLHHNAIINNQFEFIWDGRSHSGNKVANGIYFCRIINNNGKYDWVKLAVLRSE